MSLAYPGGEEGVLLLLDMKIDDYSTRLCGAKRKMRDETDSTLHLGNSG
jgi:hypothetical protein